MPDVWGSRGSTYRNSAVAGRRRDHRPMVRGAWEPHNTALHFLARAMARRSYENVMKPRRPYEHQARGLQCLDTRLDVFGPILSSEMRWLSS
jgi:hypothetical protein